MADLSTTIEVVVREERGRILGGLMRLSGSLDAAEEAFQEAMLAALHEWKVSGVPDNPGAWLMTVAKNRARDMRRRHAVAEAKASLLLEDEMSAPETIDTISDDYLRLIFTCCHPALSADNQIYDELLAMTRSAVVALNRAIAVSMLRGPVDGLAELTALEAPLSSYHLFYATRADFLERAGRDPRDDLRRAIALATNDGERRLLELRLETMRA